MSEASPLERRLREASAQYRRSARMALIMGALSVVSVLSHFMPILGVRSGVFPWWMTGVTVVLFAFTALLAYSAKGKRDEVAAASKSQDETGAERPSIDDVKHV